LREVRALLPEQRFVYIGDDAGFSYADWQEDALVERIVTLFDRYIAQFNPQLAIVACNTASTLILPALRSRFAIPFVGTVPAIKPAAERTRSGLVSLLATSGTIKRPYIRKLIDEFAAHVDVSLVGSKKLARMAEAHMQHKPLDVATLAAEIRPCFLEKAGKQTDIVMLGCTHYPFLVNEMRKQAPWPVDWLNPAEAIARHAYSLVGVATDSREAQVQDTQDDVAIMTSDDPGLPVRRLLKGFGFRLIGSKNGAACGGG